MILSLQVSSNIEKGIIFFPGWFLTTFKLNEVTEMNKFSLEDISFSDGIHVFLNKVRAQLYLLEKVDFGIYTWWRDDGIKLYEIS